MTLLEDLAKDLATLANNPFQDLGESYASSTPPGCTHRPDPPHSVLKMQQPDASWDHARAT